MIRIVVADDQLLVRSGFRIILEQQPDFEVCGEAMNGAEAVALVRELDPDVALMDIRMPQLNGLDATRAIVRESPRTRVLVLTTYDLDEYVVAALREGASGYLLKDVNPAELVRCVRAVASGETALAQVVLRRMVDEFLHHDAASADPVIFERLSERERAVLTELTRGMTNAEIAAALVVSPATVKTHVASILSKLGLRDRVQAVILAYETGFAGSGAR
ncbi:response regulator [Leifsonia sp. Root112D2]|uniref:response regulator n=1 Tax=Leifsonia sp. Root112D2 TaxID=1736426 RepID=UPI0006FE5780|nr:response regulator transcription factor [Leifsonia sp. Root112D2]KQV06895.1 LuxR family transcriptional regulator [Leifsonia sp. Root112D2]